MSTLISIIKLEEIKLYDGICIDQFYKKCESGHKYFGYEPNCYLGYYNKIEFNYSKETFKNNFIEEWFIKNKNTIINEINNLIQENKITEIKDNIEIHYFRREDNIDLFWYPFFYYKS